MYDILCIFISILAKNAKKIRVFASKMPASLAVLFLMISVT